MAARQAARRRLEQPVRFFPQRWQRKFSVQPFFKRLAGWRGSAPPRFPQKAKSPNDTQKIRKGSQNVPVGRFGEGEPYQGVPLRTQSCKNYGVSPLVAAQLVARPMKLGARKAAAATWERRHAAAGAVFRFGRFGAAVMPQFLRNCGRGDRGRPAGRLFSVLGCARGATE